MLMIMCSVSSVPFFISQILKLLLKAPASDFSPEENHPKEFIHMADAYVSLYILSKLRTMKVCCLT